jgi:phosphocarrier protein
MTDPGDHPGRCPVVLRSVRVGSAAGLHARAAAVVAAAAAGQPVRVTIRRGRRVAPADSVLGLLSLGAVRGAELILEARGPAAGPALSRLAALLARDLDAARA